MRCLPPMVKLVHARFFGRFLPIALLMGSTSALLGDNAARGEDLVLVQDGQPRAMIVLADPPSPAAKTAANLLRDELKAISGATLEIKSESKLGETLTADGHFSPSSSASAPALILVGEGKLVGKIGLSSQGLGPGGIQLERRGDCVALFGADDKTVSDPRGTLYAVTTFLEDQLGCRYLWPGELGKIIPRRSTIAIGALSVRYSPPVLQRRIRDMGLGDRLQVGLDRLGFTADDYLRQRKAAIGTKSADQGWQTWNRLGGSLELRSGHAFGHYWKQYGKEHPDWFAWQPSGTRDQSPSPDRARLCKTNPGLIQQIVKDKCADLAAGGRKAGSVSICPNDGGRNTFCMCPECKKLDPPQGRKIQLMYEETRGGRTERKFFDYVSLTDRMVHFYNAVATPVAAQFPEALLVADAYSVYSAPPIAAKLHPSLVVRFVPMTYLDEQRRQQDLRDWDAWAAAASKIFYRPNCLLAGRRHGTALVYVRRMADDIRYLSNHRMIATDFDSCVHNWATQGLNYYALARLLWNPQLRGDEIIRDYCRSGFGAGAEPVERYFLKVQELTDTIAQKQLEVTEPFTAKAVAELRALLDDAAKRTADDREAAARVAFLRRGLDYTDLQAQAYRFTSAEPKPEKKVVQELLQRREALMKEIFQRDFLAVNVAYVVWGEGFPWRKLGWQWTTPPRK